VGLEPGPLSLVRINVELLERTGSGFGLENRAEITAVGKHRAKHATPLYPPKLEFKAVDQSVYVAYGLKSNEVCCFIFLDIAIPTL
jgi:hypothetical protein